MGLESEFVKLGKQREMPIRRLASSTGYVTEIIAGKCYWRNVTGTKSWEKDRLSYRNGN